MSFPWSGVERKSDGVAPTRTRKKAHPVPKHSSWDYSSGKLCSEVIDVYPMASLVVRALEPHADKIEKAKAKYSLEAVPQVVLVISPDPKASMPAVGFDPHVISFLNSVGASIDIDTYRGKATRHPCRKPIQ